MNINIYAAEPSPLFHIRYMGCNRRPHRVAIGPMLRESYIIHYVTKGRGHYNGNPVKVGQGFLITPGHVETYAEDPADPWELLWIVSEDASMEKLFAAFHANAETGIFSYDYVDAVRRAGETMLLMNERVLRPSALLELFFSIYKYQEQTVVPQEQNYVDFALTHIHKNYQEPVSIGDLTNLLGISQPYLFRIFKAAIGKSPKQYLSDYRLHAAKKLLKETSLTVTQVAASVGYPDPLSFSKFFKKKQGISPEKFRQNKAGTE